jgi:hypothetical protein
MVRIHEVYSGKTGLTTQVPFTAEEEAEADARALEWANKTADRKLVKIKQIRLQKLQETDFWVLRGNMTVEQSDWRQSLRDIPANHTDEAAYDLLLNTDSNGQLTHAIWSKP